MLPEIKGKLIGPVQIIKEDEQTTFSAGSGPDEIRDDLESARLTLLRIEGADNRSILVLNPHKLGHQRHPVGGGDVSSV